MSGRAAVRRFFAYILMAVGGLIAVVCGGCTAVFLTAVWQNGIGNISAFLFMGMIAFVVGGLPTLIGVALFVGGQAMKRRADEQAQRDVDPPTS